MPSDPNPDPASSASPGAAAPPLAPDKAAGTVAALEVVYRSHATLQPDPRNARTHSKQQIQQIAASIQSFGFTNPILIDEAGVIIAGHGRFRAAKSLEVVSVPTITLAGLNEGQKRALCLADNKIALGAGWDMEILKLELAELGTLNLDFDLSTTGFSTGEIDVILKGSPDPEDEVIPAVPETPRSQVGDIWQLGSHRIGCGDGRDVGFLQKVIGQGALVDVAFLRRRNSASASLS